MKTNTIYDMRVTQDDDNQNPCPWRDSSYEDEEASNDDREAYSDDSQFGVIGTENRKQKTGFVPEDGKVCSLHFTFHHLI